jgi:hypothetical protein
MDLCSSGHDEICYDGRGCPACELLRRIDSLENEVQGLLQEVDSLKSGKES